MESESVRSLVEPKLTQYAEWRKRWPLWTGDPTAWLEEGQLDRIHWSSWLLLTELGIGLQSALGPSYVLTNPLTENLHYMALRKTGDSPGPICHRLPDLYQMRVLASAAQFAASVPKDVDEIEVPKLGLEGIPAWTV